MENISNERYIQIQNYVVIPENMEESFINVGNVSCNGKILTIGENKIKILSTHITSTPNGFTNAFHNLFEFRDAYSYLGGSYRMRIHQTLTDNEIISYSDIELMYLDETTPLFHGEYELRKKYCNQFIEELLKKFNE